VPSKRHPIWLSPLDRSKLQAYHQLSTNTPAASSHVRLIMCSPILRGNTVTTASDQVSVHEMHCKCTN
jgi:hypothetical protein